MKQVMLLGRINVGKSTLFNRLTEKSSAIVSMQPGTTRDRRFGVVEWRGKEFNLVDAGGLLTKPQQAMEKAVQEQALRALKEADVILLVVDALEGLIPEDRALAKIARKTGKPILLVINKTDGPKKRTMLNEFLSLGFNNYPVSALTGGGTGDLLDAVLETLPEESPVAPQKKAVESIKVLLIGKTNAGKSSLINALLRDQRMIVSAEEHTTREPQDVSLSFEGQSYIFIDTAGIRKKSKRQGLEKVGVTKTEELLKIADVAVLVMDITKPITAQDSRLAGFLKAAGSGLVLALNKWDAIPDKTTSTMNEITKKINLNFPYLTWAPPVFMSAIQPYNLRKLLRTVKEVSQSRQTEIPEDKLNSWFKQVLRKHQPARGKGTKQPVLYNIKQVATAPPKFEIIKDRTSILHLSYIRFLENQFRDAFDLKGTPIQLVMRSKRH